jgi:hypothetical protein
MGFTDLLSSSFLFSIAIIIILIGAIFAYVSYRMSEQDHKISSMLGLVSTMAEEMQFFRNKISKLQQQEQEQQQEQDYHISHNQDLFDPNNLLHVRSIQNNNLISVSDDENEESNSDDTDEDSNSDDTDEESNTDDTDEESSSDEETKLDHFKIEEVGEVEEVEDLEQKNNFLNINNVDQLDKTEPEPETENNNIKTIHLEEIVDINETEIHIHNSLDNSFSEDFKTISIFDLEETNKKANDYKKMSLNKLREAVIEKGLVSDASKMKKNELLKLLEDE